MTTERTRLIVDYEEFDTYYNDVRAFTGNVPDLNPVRPESKLIRVQSTDRITTDHVIPDYHARIRAGEVINNPYNSRLRTTYRGGALHELREEFDGNPQSRWHIYSGNRDILKSTTSDDIFYVNNVWKYQHKVDEMLNRVRLEATARAKSSSAQTLATLGELKKTVGFITGNMRSIAQLLKQAKRRFKNGVPKSAQHLSFRDLVSLYPKKWSEIWLGYRYGIRPLVYDINNHLEALESLGQPLRVKFSSSDSLRLEDEFEVGNYSINYAAEKYHRAKITMNYSNQHTIDVSSGILAEWDVSNLTPVKAFGLDAVASSAWELVPFSFVIDWLFNIGTLIQAWEPRTEFNARAKYDVVRRSSLSRVSYVPGSLVVYNDNMSVKQVSANYQFYEKYTERFVDKPLPLLPNVANNLNIPKLADLLALLIQLTK